MPPTAVVQPNFGDLVSVRWLKDLTTLGRVVVEHMPVITLDGKGLIEVPYVVVATHLPFMTLPPGVRVLPTGTPTYASFSIDDVEGIKRDPEWHPFSRRPTAEPADVRVIAGDRRWRHPSIEALNHVGAYIPSTWYPRGAPAWVWEEGWREANISHASRGWIKVQFRNGYRRPKGPKAYRPHEVCPAICQESESGLSVDWNRSPVPRWESFPMPAL